MRVAGNTLCDEGTPHHKQPKSGKAHGHRAYSSQCCEPKYEKMSRPFFTEKLVGFGLFFPPKKTRAGKTEREKKNRKKKRSVSTHMSRKKKHYVFSVGKNRKKHDRKNECRSSVHHTDSSRTGRALTMDPVGLQSTKNSRRETLTTLD